MKSKREIIVVLACLVFLLLAAGAIGVRGREQGRRVVCANNLRQLGAVLDMYCEDNQSYYPPVYSYWYLHGSSIGYSPNTDAKGLVLILPYLVDTDGSIRESQPQNYLMYLKSRDNVRYLKFFWCPSGAMQYNWTWQGTAFAAFGYNQYCSRDATWPIQLGDATRPVTQSYEHSPLKNIPHINGGRTEDGQWITYKSDSTWITFTDINFQGIPLDLTYTRSNHYKFVKYTYLERPLKEHGAAGSNALHVGGNVTWHMEEDIKRGSPKSLGCWIKGGTGPDAPAICETTSYWMFPRTE